MSSGQMQRSSSPPPVTIIGGGIAGLVAAITCAEIGSPVRVWEARKSIGGRGRAGSGPFIANFGPHALYKGRANWRWLSERGLLPPMANLLLAVWVSYTRAG